MCDYKIIEGGYNENYKLVRQIRSRKQALSYDENGYIDNQQCWARFKCSNNLIAKWRIVKLETEGPDYDTVIFYGVNNGQSRRYSGLYGSTNIWSTLNDSEITFEFRADADNEGGKYYLGFEILVICD